MSNHTIETLFTASIIVDTIGGYLLLFNKNSGKLLDNGITNLQLVHMLWI